MLSKKLHTYIQNNKFNFPEVKIVGSSGTAAAARGPGLGKTTITVQCATAAAAPFYFATSR